MISSWQSKKHPSNVTPTNWAIFAAVSWERKIFLLWPNIASDDTNMGKWLKPLRRLWKNQCLLQSLWLAFLRFAIWLCGN